MRLRLQPGARTILEVRFWGTVLTMARSSGTSGYSDGSSEASADGPSWRHSQAATIQMLNDKTNLLRFQITCLKQNLGNYEQINESGLVELTHQDHMRELKASKQYRNKYLQSASDLAQSNLKLQVETDSTMVHRV